MESSLIIAGSVAATTSVLFAAVSLFIPRGDEFDIDVERLANMDLNWENSDYSETPPEPLFNLLDNQECEKNVLQYYEWASWAHLTKQMDDKRLEKSFQDILDRQKRYRVELIDNVAFLDWTVSDWEQTWEARTNPDAKKPDPKQDYSMTRVFLSSPNGRGKKYLRSTKQVEDAVQTVYYFRVSYGLEDSVYSVYYYDEPDYYVAEDEQETATVEDIDAAAVQNLAKKFNKVDKKSSPSKESDRGESEDKKWHEQVQYEDYAMCSRNTRNLVDIYAHYVQYNEWDVRVLKLYPLLDRIALWIDTEYGSSEAAQKDDQ